MVQPNTTTNTEFDDLFDQLLNTVAEEQDIRSGGGTSTGLIEIRDRLHALRSRLATVRNLLATVTATGLHEGQPPRFAV